MEPYMKQKNFWRKLSGWMRAFLIVAFAFLIVGLGTLGSVQSTGKSYELPVKKSGDEKEPCILIQLSAPEGYSSANISIREIYLNAGTVYSEAGTQATIRISRGTSATSSFVNYTDVAVVNGYEVVEETNGEGAATTSAQWGGMLYNWISVSECGSQWSSSGYTLSTYSYFQITARTCNVVLNEIVFVGVDKTLSEEKQVPVLIPAKVNAASVLYDTQTGEVSNDVAIRQASAVVDAQRIPATAQSSFFRYGEEETYSMMSVTEMRFGNSYYSGDIYHGDRVYNSLGTDILALGTAIFGMSPFGLRFFPFLASFGILVLGFCFVKKLFGSDRSGFAFALLYVLCGSSLSLGHLGTPLMIGLFFLFASLYACYLFYANGMKKANFASAIPLLLSGLSGAAAVCVNGAYVLPVLGVVALFAAGMVRQVRERRRLLDLAIAEAEAEEKAPVETDETVVTGKQKVVNVMNDYRYKNRVAPAIFIAFLVLGTVILSMLGVLPMYYTYVKLYGNPASSVNVLSLIWKAFVGGYTGSNFVTAHTVWSAFYRLFVGSGDVYAVTAAGLLPSAVAVFAGVVGLVFAIVRYVKLMRGKETKGAVVSAYRILAIGLVLSLVTALFAQGGPAFLFAAALFLFAFAAASFGESGNGKGDCAIAIVGTVLLVVWFLLFAVTTFSVPLPATFWAKFLG